MAIVMRMVTMVLMKDDDDSDAETAMAKRYVRSCSGI